MNTNQQRNIDGILLKNELPEDRKGQCKNFCCTLVTYTESNVNGDGVNDSREEREFKMLPQRSSDKPRACQQSHVSSHRLCAALACVLHNAQKMHMYCTHTRRLFDSVTDETATSRCAHKRNDDALNVLYRQ